MSLDTIHGRKYDFTDEERNAIRRAVLRSGPGGVARMIGQVGIDRQYLTPNAAPQPPSFEELTAPAEPLIDVFVESDILIVVADLPGQERAAIDWRLARDTLTFTAQGRDWVTVALPHNVEQVIDHRWRNGILTLQLARAYPAPILQSRAVGDE